jgi:hypothetical protein
MFHPIPPDLSGTDGTMNLSENGATRLALMRENTSDLQSDTLGVWPAVRIVAAF